MGRQWWVEEYCDGASREPLGSGRVYEWRQWHARSGAYRESRDGERSRRVPVGVGFSTALAFRCVDEFSERALYRSYRGDTASSRLRKTTPNPQSTMVREGHVPRGSLMRQAGRTLLIY